MAIMIQLMMIVAPLTMARLMVMTQLTVMAQLMMVMTQLMVMAQLMMVIAQPMTRGVAVQQGHTR